MKEKHKAYCGDAIALLIIRELKVVNRQSYGRVLSNKCMTFAYAEMEGFDVEENIKDQPPDKLKLYYKEMGTKFEAKLYDIFIEEGYQAAKKLVIDYLIPQLDNLYY